MQAHRRHVGTGPSNNDLSGGGSSHRRRRKSSIQASIDTSDISNKYDHGRKASNGFWSFFQRRGRGRKTDSPDRGDTLLPTTYNNSNSMESSPKPKRAFKNTTALLCGNNNSFLMGGVDKRRFRRKPKGLLWRIFWSSLPRRLCVSFGLLYVIVYHVLVPFGEWCLFGSSDGIWNSGNSHRHRGRDILARLQHDTRFDTRRSIEEEREYQNRLQKKRESIRASNGEREKILEAIAPEFYHRNDPGYFDSERKDRTTASSKNGRKSVTTASQEDNNPENDANNSKDESDLDNVVKPVADEVNEQLPDTTKADRKIIKAQKLAESKRHYHKIVDKSDGRILEVTGGIAVDDDAEDESELLPLRTIQNEHQHAAAFSSCGTKSSKQTTLVVQTSIDRLWILKETCTRWKNDPIVAVVFVPHESTYEDEDDEEGHSRLLGLLHNTERELTQGDSIACPNLKVIRYMADKIESLQGRYPVNRMRNVGLDLVQTSHVLMMDVDFVPSQDLDIHLKDSGAMDHHDTAKQTHRALVVPAFEKKAPKECNDSEDPVKCMSQFLRKDGNFLPRTFSQLQECYTHGSKDCVVFQSEFNWDGHSTTRSEEWIHEHWYDDETEKSFRSIPCFHTSRYEPYVVLEWCPNDSSQTKGPIAPYYDERFYGYGKNKIELVSYLRRSGYEFRVLPEGFIVHNPHPESKTKETWNNKDEDQLHLTMDALYNTFMGELDVTYREIHEDTVKLCHEGKS